MKVNRDWDRLEGRTRIWSAIRWAKKFSLEDLSQISGEPIDSGRKYCGLLVRSGYLRLTHRANTHIPGDANTYLLIRDSGPLPPCYRITQSVWDPNLGREFEIEDRVTVNQRIWSWIKDLPPEYPFRLATIAEDLNINLRSVRKYAKDLLFAGILGRINRGEYLLIEDWGLVAPRFDRDGQLIEPEQEEIL